MSAWLIALVGFIYAAVAVEQFAKGHYLMGIDRHECNACARAWNESGYTLYIGWEPKKIAIGPEDV